MHCCRGSLLLLIAQCLFFAGPGAKAQAPVSADGKPWRVLTLALVDPQMPATLVYTRSFKNALEAAAPGKVSFFSESFDAPTFDSKNMETEMVAYLAKKYANQPIDLVVGVTAEKLDFIDKHHEQLWPGAAVIFASAHERGIGISPTLRKYPFVAWRADVPGTLKLMQSLRPDARRLVVIGGTSELDAAVLSNSQAALDGNRQWDVEFWTHYTLAELRERLALLPKDTFVLFSTLFRDNNGAFLYPRDALEYIAEKSTVPVFGMFSTYAGHRMVAGSVIDVQQLGAQAAALAMRVLTHQQAPLADMQTFVQAHCFADAKRLDEYGLSAQALPAGCDIQNPLRNLWTDYKAVVLTAFAVIALQAGTIGAMFWQRRRRRAAELENAVTQGELQRAMRFAAMGELTASLAHEINQPLGAILSNAEAAEMLLARGTIAQGDLKAILSDIRRDDQRAVAVVDRVRTLLKKSPVQQGPLHWHAVIQEVLTVLMPELRNRGVAITTSLDANHDLIMGDAVQLQQLVLNLVINALDALDATARRLRRIQVTSNDDEGFVCLSVQDNGQGISEAALPRIFESFYTTKTEGLGMGLAIVNTIVHSHGGSVEVESQPGQGTVFRVKLPLFSEPP